MEGATYEKKVKDMQKYIPFLENLITKLEKSQEKSRETQLTKMRMLYGLLTKKDKKLKLETLLKCETVLEKLYKKVEKNLGDCESASSKKISKTPDKTEKSKDSIEIEELSAPASPQNSDGSVEFHAPIVIPTERRNSPSSSGNYRNKDKSTYDNNRNTDKYDRLHYKNPDSKTELYKRRSPSHYDQARGNRFAERGYNYDRYHNRRDRYYEEEQYNSERQSRPYERGMYFERRPYSNSPSNEMWKNKPTNNEAWKSNENKPSSSRAADASPPSDSQSKHRDTIFNRLGDKVDVNNPSNFENFRIKITNDKIKKKRVPTPVSEVLKSPPLSANDIDDLMNESGGKSETDEKKELSDLEAVRKKLNNEIGICKKKAKELSSTKEAATKSVDHDIVPITVQDFTPKMPQEILKEETISNDPIINNSPALKSPELKEPIQVKPVTPHIENPIPPSASIKLPIPDKPLFPAAIHLEKTYKPTSVQQPPAPQTDTSNVRLAYKYNPHPRRLPETLKNEELAENINKPSDPRMNRPTINTLPSVNMADPRLRNRPILSVPPPNILDVNLSNPPFPNLEARRPPVHPLFPIFSGYQQQGPQPVPPPVSMPNQMIRPINPKNVVQPSQIPQQTSPTVPVPNQMARPLKPPNSAPPSLLSLPIIKPPESKSNHGYNKFHPMMNDQVERMKYLESKKNKFEPKTYGEYRQAKLAEQSQKEKNKYEPYKSPTPRRDSVDVAPPSCLDKMYRKSEFKQDVPSVGNFKIPKVTKPKQDGADAEKPPESSVASSDNEITASKDNKKNTKLDDKKEKEKEKTKPSNLTSSEKDKGKEEKTESKKDKVKSTDTAKSDKVDGKHKSEKSKDKTSEKSKDKTSEKLKSKPSEENTLKKKDKHEKIESEKKDSKKLNETKDDKKEGKKESLPTVSVAVSPKEPVKNEEKEEVDNNSNANSSSDKSVDDKIDSSDNDESSSKNKPRRRNSITIVPSTTDNSIISTQNIITGKRRTRSVLPPPPPPPTPPSEPTEQKVNSNKRKTRSKVVPKDNIKDETEAVVLKSDDIKSKEESDTCIVSSTTTSSNEEPHSSTTDHVEVKKEESKSEVTKEWLEGVLINIFNPAMMNKNNVLNMLEKVLDEKKFKQIKEIVDESNEEEEEKKPVPETSIHTEEKRSETPSEDKKEEFADAKDCKTPEPKKKKRTELDKLNEDIRDMFISQGVLTATGRRMCTMINEEKKSEEIKPKDCQQQKQKPQTKNKQPKATVANKKGGRGRPKGSFKKKRLLPKRNVKSKQENVSEGLGLAKEIVSTDDETLENRKRARITPEKDTNIDSEMPILEAQTPIKSPEREKSDHEVEEVTNDRPKVKKKYKPCPKSKRKIQLSSDDDSDDEIEEIKDSVEEATESEKTETQAEIIEEERPEFFPHITDQSNSEFPNEAHQTTTPTSTPKTPKVGKQERKKRGKKPFWGTGNEIVSTPFKNIDPNMHVKSAYVNKCVICGFVGRRMCNHYVHAHSDSEVPISRLPPETLRKLKAGEINRALFSYKKVDNNTVYQHQCPFCDVKSSLTRKGWEDHFGTHTGEYAFKCSDCNRFLNLKQMIQKHIKLSCPNGRILNLRETDKDRKRVLAYVCDLCNYLQMNRKTIVKHLKEQHDESSELITGIALIDCENVPRVNEDKRAAIIEENKESRRAHLSKMGDDQIEAFMPKDCDINLDPNFIKYMKDVSFSTGDLSERSSTSIVDQISERLKEADSDFLTGDFGMFQHSIFNDMSIVERLTERLQDDLNKQSQSQSTNDLLTINNSQTSEANTTSDEQSAPVSDISMSNVTPNNVAASGSGLPDSINESANSDSMAERLCQRFSATENRDSNDPSPLSMADRLCKRFKTNSEQEKIDTSNRVQAVVYVVDKIDEQIANADHVKASEMKVPSNEDDNSSFSDTLNQSPANSESILKGSGTRMVNVPQVSAEKQNTSDKILSHSDTTTSLVEKIKMCLSGDKNDLCNKEHITDTPSVVTEPVKNAPSFISPEKNISGNHSTPKARMSIVERLSKRLNSIAQDIVNTELIPSTSEDKKTTSEMDTSKNSEPTKDNQKSASNDVDSSFEGDLVIDEEDRVVSKPVNETEKASSASSKQVKDISSKEVACTVSSQEDVDSEMTEIQDDDNDDWEDIEILSSEESAGELKHQEKPKKKLTFDTFSRLYALSNQRNKTASSKKEKNSKKNLKGSEKRNHKEEAAKVLQIQEKQKDNVPKESSKDPSSMSTAPSTTIAQEDAQNKVNDDPLALPAEIEGQLSTVSTLSSSTQAPQSEKDVNKSTESDPLALPSGTEGQFNSLTTSVVSLPTATDLTTVVSVINPTISTITNPLGKDLGDISGLLGLNNQIETDPLAQPNDPLDLQSVDVNGLNPTILVLPDQANIQEATGLDNALDDKVQDNTNTEQGTSPVDAVATGNKNAGFEVVQPNNGHRSNISEAKNQNSTTENRDSCSSVISISDPITANSPIIHRIDKLGFSKNSENLFKYHCLVESCSFLYSELPIGLQNHFMIEHPGVMWEGYCYSCEASVCNDQTMTLSREYKHMLDVHIKSLAENITTTENSSKPPLIKLRRLSGDMLSVNQTVGLECPLLEKALSNSVQTIPKIHNKTTEPEKLLTQLKVTTKTAIIKVPNKTTTNLTDNKSMLDAYLVRNNVPNIKSVTIAQKEEVAKNTSLIVNNSTSASGSELKIASVAENVNQDLLHQQNSNSEPFFKIKEVVSLSASSSANIKTSSSSAETTIITTKPMFIAPSKPSSALTTKPNILQIQVSALSETPVTTVSATSNEFQPSSSKGHSLLLKPANKSLNISSNNASTLKIQSVTSLTTSGSNQLVLTNIPKSTEKAPNENMPANLAPKLLKPWINSSSFKSKAVINKLLEDVPLYCQFKCMGHDCAFATNSSQLMTIHLKQHTDMLESLNQPDEAYKNSWRECPYCTDRQVTNKFLIDHLIHAHGKDIYQCPYCFYRSCVDHNIIVHINTFHKNREKAVLVCYGEQRRLSTEISQLAKFRTNNVRPIKCFECLKSFYILRNYVKHIKEHNPQSNVYRCFSCFSNVFKHQAEKHLLAKHNIAVYECIYCLFATELMDMMRIHMANRHPSCLSYMCVRLSPNKNFDSTEETLESSTVLANLAESVDEKLLRRCPYSISQLNHMNPAINAPDVDSTTNVTSLVCQKSKDLEIASVQSISTEFFENLESNSQVRTPDTGKINETQVISEPAPSLQTSPAIEFQTTTEELSAPSESDIATREKTYIRILEAAKEMVQSTGFEGKELYKCAECSCPPALNTAVAFHIHMHDHIDAGKTDLKCFHCTYSTKNLLALKNHLKAHCVHRYFCYFCNYTGPTSYNLIKHISDSHSKTGMVTYPLIFGQTNKSKDFFVICPKNIKQIEIIQFGERMVRAWERKKALTKKYFTPDEVDLLPRQAIFFNEVHCQVCDYRTKVRTNMFRHLQFHKQEVKVATVDPVNPVPCLNSNERHFDKMVNLACSSNINKDGRNAGGKDEMKIPDFVPGIKRYGCGVPGCTYLTISENMMKWHLSALHSNEKIYICPHCSAEVCKKNICAERILNHLKYHDSKLFLCSVCSYIHHQKHIVERHINEKHPTGACSIISYERDGTDTIKTTEPVVGRKNVTPSAPPTPVAKEDEMKWECGLCKTRRPTYNQMVCHMNRAHEVKNRYQCVHCDFGGAQVSNIVVHVAEKHPTKVKEARCMFYKVNENPAEQQLQDHTTPIWTRDPCRVKNIRGILMEDEEESQRNLATGSAYEEEDEEESIPASVNKISKSNESNKSALSTPSVKNPTAVSKVPKTYGGPKKTDSHFSCEECSYYTKTASELQLHMKTNDHKSLASETDNFIFCCYHCMHKVNTILGVRKHWALKHQVLKKDRTDPLSMKELPFWFKLFPQVSCARCSYKNEIQTVLRHHQHQHSGTRIAISSSDDTTKCSQCSYVYKDCEDLGQHFLSQHPRITSSRISLTDDAIEKILKQGLTQKFTKCLKCNCVPVANESFNDHQNRCHAFTVPTYEFIQGEVLYLCTQCYFVSDEETTLRHMYTHPFNCTYKCFSCDAKHKIFADFVEHLQKAHKTAPNQSTISKCIDNKIKQLNEVRVLLPNGLVLEKSQLTGTKYGDTSLITRVAREEFAAYLKPTKTSADEPESAYNSEAESVNSSKTVNSRSGHAKKKRRVSGGRGFATIDKFDDDEEWKPKKKLKDLFSSQYEEIKELPKEEKEEKAPIKTEDKKPVKVDLSKIYTTMTIGGSEVPISCDRFAKLVKIRTCVKLERIDISKYLKDDSSMSSVKRKSRTAKQEPSKKLKTS